MKRRVVKVGDRRYRVELPGGDVSEFSYRESPRRWDPDQCSYVDFELDEDRYTLSWEGIFMDSFPTEADVLLFILRFGYSVDDKFLVPSEVLADVNLAYEAGDWVDEWWCQDKHEVVFALGEVKRPEDRKIRFEGFPRITSKRDTWVEGTYFDAKGLPHAYHVLGRGRRFHEVVAEIKIPELDFEELEKPKRRRFEIPRTWADHSECAYGGYSVRRRPEPTFRPDKECVITLKSGKAAKKAFESRKKKTLDLQE